MKRQYTDYELKELIKSLFTDNDFSITTTDSQNNITQVNSIVDYLNIEFYTQKKDLRDSNYFNPFDIDSINQYVRSLGQSLKKAFGLVEITNNTPMTALDLDGGNLVGKVSIVIQTDRVANLDFYITYLRNKYVGVFEDIVSQDKTYTSHIVISGLDKTEVYECALGQCITATFEISIAYLEKAETYQDDTFTISLDNTNFYSIPISRKTKSLIFTGKTQTRQDNPTQSGLVNASASVALDLTYWLIESNDFFNELDLLMEKASCEHYTINSGVTPIRNNEVNIPVYAKTTRVIVDTTYTFYHKYTITSYVKQYVNNDMTIVNLKLGTYAK